VRYAVLADIHANLQALEAVCADVRRAGAERMLCLGDIVGYGADPRECLQMVRDLNATIVAGNHDWATVGRLNVDYFNSDARDSVHWTRSVLSTDEVAFLKNLDLINVLDGVTLVHGSPFSPDCFEYIQTNYDVEVAFEHLATPLCFVGHSHVPVIFEHTDPVDYFVRDEYEVPDDRQVIVNVGSVGQPRDLDPRASYVVYDDRERTVTTRRVEYDVSTASSRIVEAGLPSTNSVRIVLGR